MKKINFAFDKNPKQFGYDDFIFEILEKKIKKSVDTYYFALDNNFMANDESQVKVILALINYLNLLIEKIKGLGIDNVQLLYPIDFSDEYIGFLIIQKINEDNLKINYGITSEKFGWSFNPSKSGEFDQNIKIEYFDNWDYVISISDFINDINLSIKQISGK